MVCNEEKQRVVDQAASNMNCIKRLSVRLSSYVYGRASTEDLRKMMLPIKEEDPSQFMTNEEFLREISSRIKFKEGELGSLDLESAVDVNGVRRLCRSAFDIKKGIQENVDEGNAINELYNKAKSDLKAANRKIALLDSKGRIAAAKESSESDQENVEQLKRRLNDLQVMYQDLLFANPSAVAQKGNKVGSCKSCDALRNALEAKGVEATKQCEGLAAERDRILKESSEAINKLRSELSSKHAGEMGNIQNQHAEALAKLQLDLEKGHSEALEKIRDGHREAIRKLEDEIASLRRTSEMNNQTVKDLNKKFSEAVTGNEQLEQQLEFAKNQISELRYAIHVPLFFFPTFVH